MDELCSENDFNYFAINGDNQQCPEMNPAATFFLLLGMIPISILFAMISISQHMRLTGDLIIEEDEDIVKEIPYHEKYPLKKNNTTNKEPNTELLSVMECTPNGNVFMKYNLENEGFDYWSDYKEIPFNHLETVARRYVNIFMCADLYLREEDDEEEESEYSSDFDEETTSDEDESEEKTEEVSETKQPDSDDEIFAKFKTAEKIKEVVEEEGAIVNKFRYKGKLVDILEFKQKINKKEAPKNISFSSWKPF